MAGAALTADGDVLRAACDGKTWISDVWEEGGGVPEGWARAGVRVTRGRPAAGAPWSGEWEGAWEREGGGRGEGRLVGLRPVAGVETDAGGARREVVYDGRRTLAEALVATPMPESRRRLRGSDGLIQL